MPAVLTFENDALTPITTLNFGSVGGNASQSFRVNITNTGNITATSVQIVISRVTSNDGVDFTQLAPDVAGAPGTFTTTPLTVGTLAAGAVYWFWIKVTVPVGASPAGNPRVFNVATNYSGT